MNDYILSCCTTADLPDEHFKARNISYICFHFLLDGKEYPDDLGKSMPLKDFYQAMRDGAMTKTSQVNADEFIEYFEGFLKEGKDVLHLSLSSGISGVLNSALIAKNELEERYPDRKIYVVDSLAATSGYGLLMDKLADLRDEGKTIDEVHDWAVANRLRINHWFFVSDLTYLVRGGRVSKASGFIGGMLNICPLLNIAYDGKLVVRQKIRTRKKVIAATIDKMEQYAEGGLDYSDKCYISHADCIEDAQEMAKVIEGRFPKLKGKVQICNVGTTIGSHTGPGALVLLFWGSERSSTGDN